MTTTTELKGALIKSSFDNEMLVQTLNTATITRENESVYGLMALLAGYSWSILEQYMSNTDYPFSPISFHTDTPSEIVYSSANIVDATGSTGLIDTGFVYNSSLGESNTDTFVISNFAIPAAADAVNLHAADIIIS